MRFYSSSAGVMSLTGGIDTAATTIVVNTTAGLPAQTPFTLVLDPGNESEEIVTVTNTSGSTLTVTRGEDGSAAVSHATGAKVRHMMTARDLREPQQHIASTGAVHGLTGDIVGTSDFQALTNKIIDGTNNTLQGIPASAVDADSGVVADTASAQTLTNKTISGLDNTLSNVPRTALPGQVVYSDTDVDFDSNVTFTSPGTGSVAVKVKGIVGLTANLYEVVPYGGGQPATFDKDANLSVPGLTTESLMVAGNPVGGEWQAYGPALGGIALGNGTKSFRYCVNGDTVHVEGVITLGSTSVITGTITVPLPVLRRHNGSAISGSCFNFDASATGTAARAPWFIIPDEYISTTAVVAVSVAGVLHGPASPFAWAAGDTISWAFSYEAA